MPVNATSNLNDLKKELASVCRRLFAENMQKSDGGNVSCRITEDGTDRMLIKASMCSFGDLTEDNFTKVSLDGTPLVPSQVPSKERFLHSAIYSAFPETSAIVHCHSPWATAAAAKYNSLPMVTYHAAIKLGGDVPVFDTGAYIVDAKSIKMIIDYLKGHPKCKAFLLRGHGLVAIGNSIAQALMLAELIEETAQIHAISNL